MVVLGLCGKGLVAEWLQGVLCEQLPGAFPMSYRANTRWIQDGPGPGHGRVPGSVTAVAPLRKWIYKDRTKTPAPPARERNENV